MRREPEEIPADVETESTNAVYRHVWHTIWVNVRWTKMKSIPPAAAGIHVLQFNRTFRTMRFEVVCMADVRLLFSEPDMGVHIDKNPQWMRSPSPPGRTRTLLVFLGSIFTSKPSPRFPEKPYPPSVIINTNAKRNRTMDTHEYSNSGLPREGKSRTSFLDRQLRVSGSTWSSRDIDFNYGFYSVDSTQPDPIRDIPEDQLGTNLLVGKLKIDMNEQQTVKWIGVQRFASHM
ncbi:hypothetical protein DFH06DRAFT_1121882 [Mycena polygramma]|nr:hypothetical protein DFH06DRAFT_1121882 [Mycena polygramma]